MHDYDRERRKVSRKAQAEFLDFCNVRSGRGLDQTLRLIDYMVTRMAFNTVISEQMPNWLIGHMMEFARREIARDRRRRKREDGR